MRYKPDHPDCRYVISNSLLAYPLLVFRLEKSASLRYT